MKTTCKTCGKELKNLPSYIEDFGLSAINWECRECFGIPEYIEGKATRALKDRLNFNPTFSSADGTSKRGRKDKTTHE